MSTLLVTFFTLVGLLGPGEADALRQTAPAYLTVDEAAIHLMAADAAAEAAGVPVELLLSIAWHESRYQPDARSREPGGRWSCGVMTPEPHVGACTPDELTVFGGYLNGARHLRTWLDLCGGNETCALRAYAGGGGLVRACASGPYYVRDGVDACDVKKMFIDRAAWIHTRLQRAATKGANT